MAHLPAITAARRAPSARILLWGALLCSALLGVGCSAGDSLSDTLRIDSPEPDQVLSKQDDVDSDQPGLQFDVKGSSRGIAGGTMIQLFIDGKRQRDEAEMDEGGNVLLKAISLPSGKHEIFLANASRSVSSDRQFYMYGKSAGGSGNGSDEPKLISFDKPKDGAKFIAGEGCKTGIDKTFGVKLSAQADMGADRDIEILVNGQPSMADIEVDDDGLISACVPVPDDAMHMPQGASDITVRVSALATDASDEATHSVSVKTLAFTKPTNDQALLLNDNCASTGYGFAVELAVDPMHMGASYTLTGGKSPFSGVVEGPQIGTCLPLDDGERTLTAGIAGTSVQASVDVTVASTTNAPKVSIESPLAGARFNLNGSGGRTADADPSSTECDAEFSIACSDLGETVELHHDTATGEVFASADCAEAAAGDAALPEGYAGRVTLVAMFDSGGPTSVVVATHTIPVGKTTATTATMPLILTADCAPPALEFDGDPCGKSNGGQLTPAEAAARDITIIDSTVDFQTISLTLARGTSTQPVSGPTTRTTGQASYPAVNLGGLGTVTLTAAATDDSGNDAQLSCTIEVTDHVMPADLPTVTITAPADEASFGPGDGCDSGITGQIGVLVEATLDKAEDRQVSILVDGDVIDDDVEIDDDGQISLCVPVMDDSMHTPSSGTTLTVRAVSTVTSSSADDERVVHAHTISISDPLQGATLVPNDNCAGVGFGYVVEAEVDASHAGEHFTLTGNAGSSVMGTIDDTTISGCLALVEGDATITASIDGTNIEHVISVYVAGGTPSIGVLIDDPDPDPLDQSYRDGLLATWDRPEEDWPGQHGSYALRCSDSAIGQSASNSAKETWWDDADAVLSPALPSVDASSPSILLTARPEVARHCVVRVLGVMDELGPILRSTDLTLALRLADIAQGDDFEQLGLRVAAAGDVDGDGLADVLLGGSGRAELLFGTSGDPEDAERVVFTGALGGVGRSVVGLGDFNGDGLDDFAIGDPAVNDFKGRVSIFFGRARAQWPDDDQDLEAACNADLCLEHASASSALGSTLASAGDFDDDGLPDLALGSSFAPSFNSQGQLFIALGGAYETRSCSGDGECNASEHCASSSCVLDAGETFWKLVIELPSGNWTNPPSGGPSARLRGFMLDSPAGLGSFANAIAGLGAFDASAGDDLAVSAPGAGQVVFLSGRTRAGSPGITTLASSDLGLRGGGGVPDGQPIATGSASEFFGNAIAATGSRFDVTGTGPESDLGIASAIVDHIAMLPTDPAAPGGPGFGTSVTISGTGGGLGASIATGLHPALGLLGDLDGDGLGDVLIGTNTSREVVLFYSDLLGDAAQGGNASQTAGISLSQGAGSGELVAQYIGDFNGDGHLDIVVGDYRAGHEAGGAALLY